MKKNEHSRNDLFRIIVPGYINMNYAFKLTSPEHFYETIKKLRSRILESEFSLAKLLCLLPTIPVGMLKSLLHKCRSCNENERKIRLPKRESTPIALCNVLFLHDSATFFVFANKLQNLREKSRLS